MKIEDYKELKNFTFDEAIRVYTSKSYNPNDAEREVAKIKFETMYALQEVRTTINSPIVLNSLTNGKHVAGSYHYLGEAVDWHCEDTHIHPNKILQSCLTAGFQGIGYYPEWRWPGFHTDKGDREWIALWKKVGGVYLPLLEDV